MIRPNSKLRQKIECKFGLQESKRFCFGSVKSIFILVLAPGFILVLHYVSQKFLPQTSPIFQNSPKLESGSSASKTFVNSYPCKGLRSAVVTIYAESEVGSGSIIDLKHYENVDIASNFIITNSHVVLPAKNGQVNVVIDSKIFSSGKVIATDLTNDLALVQLSRQNHLLKKISLADPTKKNLSGQLTCTVGNPFNLPGVIASGKVLGDRGDNDLKLDLYINPGNSGGPLINADGEMIGVVKTALYLPTGKNSGVSFATNLVNVERFIQQNLSKIVLLSQLHDSPSSSDLSVERPINFDLTNSSPNASGANSESLSPAGLWYGMNVNEDLVIVLTSPDSPAEQAGLTSGDHIISMDGRLLKNLGELQDLLSHHPTSTEFMIERYQERQRYNILVNKIN